MSVMAPISILYQMRTYSVSISFYKIVFISREPDKIERNDYILNTFDLTTWILILVLILIMSLAFKTIHMVYQSIPGQKLAGPLTHQADYILLVVGTLTEPDSIPWFPRFSAGKNQNIERLYTVKF